MSRIKEWQNEHPHISTVSIVAIVILSSILSIGLINVIPVLVGMIFFSLAQDSLSHRLNKRYQVQYFSWSVLGGSLLTSVVLTLYTPKIENWLAWWSFLLSAILAIATMSALLWTIYTTQSERSERLIRQKEDQPKRVSSRILQRDDGEVVIEVWNGSEMPIFDVKVGLIEYIDKDESTYQSCYAKSPVIAPKETQTLNLKPEEQKRIIDLGLIGYPPAILFQEASSIQSYWARNWLGTLYEIGRKYDFDDSYGSWDDMLTRHLIYSSDH